MTHYLVLGAGLQGTAAVHDLLLRSEATALTWVDNDAARLQSGLSRIRGLCRSALEQPGFQGLRGQAADAADRRALAPLFQSADVCLNALPYRFSAALTQLALEGGCHYLDLGGNTQVVREQLELHRAHPRAAELCVLPDCGLMPGMGNLFTALALQRMGDLERVALRCGGLPRDPKPPLDYMLLFSVAGLTNEYFGHAEVLRQGRVVSVATFTGLETVHVPGLGRLEAFITSGGLSTTPTSFAGRIEELDYKTLRYPGHHAKFQVLLELGLLDEDPIAVGGQMVVPRHLMHVLLERVLHHPGDRDVAVLSMEARAKSGAHLSIHVEDHFDEATGFTAMERTTAYSATACAHLVARGDVQPGPRSLELAVDPEAYLEALRARGIRVEIDERTGAQGGRGGTH